jgi:hypothetical protein
LRVHNVLLRPEMVLACWTGRMHTLPGTRRTGHPTATARRVELRLSLDDRLDSIFITVSTHCRRPRHQGAVCSVGRHSPVFQANHSHDAAVRFHGVMIRRSSTSCVNSPHSECQRLQQLGIQVSRLSQSRPTSGDDLHRVDSYRDPPVRRVGCAIFDKGFTWQSALDAESVMSI